VEISAAISCAKKEIPHLAVNLASSASGAAASSRNDVGSGRGAGRAHQHRQRFQPEQPSGTGAPFADDLQNAFGNFATLAIRMLVCVAVDLGGDGRDGTAMFEGGFHLPVPVCAVRTRRTIARPSGVVKKPVNCKVASMSRIRWLTFSTAASASAIRLPVSSFFVPSSSS